MVGWYFRDSNRWLRPKCIYRETSGQRAPTAGLTQTVQAPREVEALQKLVCHCVHATLALRFARKAKLALVELLARRAVPTRGIRSASAAAAV